MLLGKVGEFSSKETNFFIKVSKFRSFTILNNILVVERNWSFSLPWKSWSIFLMGNLVAIVLEVVPKQAHV